MKRLLLIVLPLLLMVGCEDTDVSDGVDGLTILVESDVEPNGTNCSNGGTKLFFGGDVDGDGVLDEDEITNTVYVCNGEDGNDGNDGEDGEDGNDGDDGVSNMSVSIFEMTSNNVDYIEDGSNDGYLNYEFSSNLITNDVVENGVVLVYRSSTTNPYVWTPLPNIFYGGDNSSVDYVLDCWYYYSNGKVVIGWDINYDYSWSNWLSIISYWGVYYKIVIVTPT